MRKALASLHRRRRWIAAIVLFVFVLPTLALHLAVAPYLGTKIENQVRARLRTEITVGYFLYQFPYGLSAHGIHMKLPAYDGGQIIDIDSIGIKLAELPLGDGPIIIRDLTIKHPVVQWQSAPYAIAHPTSAPSIPTPAKISDTLRLHRLSIENGQVIIRDSDAGVMAWGGIDVAIDASQHGVADYDINLTARNGQTADFTAQGRVNVDQRQASLGNFVLTVRSDEHAPSQLPPQVQRIWEKYRVRGTLRVDGSAQASLVNPAHNNFNATATLQDATGYSPEIDSTLDGLSLNAAARMQDGKLTGEVDQFSAHSGDVALGISSVTQFSLDSNTGAWSVSKICGRIDVKSPATRPSEISKPLFGSAHPSGQLVFWGHAAYAGDPNKPPDYQILFTCDHAAFDSPNQRLKMSQIALDGRFLGDHLHVHNCQFQAFGGTVAARGDISLSSPYSYVFNLDTRDASLLEIATVLDPSGSGGHMQGILRLQAQFRGKLPDDGNALDTLQGRGRFAISQGNLWDAPTLRQIERRLSIARTALTVGHAAARFSVAKRHVNLTDATISAPVMGLQGAGSVDFDSNIDFHLIAVPLENWKSELNRAHIPLVGTLLSDTAGKLQQILNSATSALLYDFHVTGTAAKPVIQTVPAPVLSVNAMNIFKDMLTVQPENTPTEMPPDTDSDSATDSNN